jgi:hypothetical protein
MSSCQPGIEETDLIEEQVDFWNEGSSIDLQRTRMAHLTALTSLTLVVLERWCLPLYSWLSETSFSRFVL